MLPGKLLLSTHDALVHLDPLTGNTVASELWGFPGGGGNLLLTENNLAVTYAGGFLVYNTLEAERESLVSTATHFMLKTYKHHGFLMETQDEYQRLKISP